MNRNKNKAIRALLFDLGGVVIEIDFDRAFRHWTPHSRLSFNEIKARYRMDAAYEKHERGEIDGSAYFDHLRSTLELDANDADIATGWNKIFVREIADTLSEIQVINHRIPCFAFSNSNPTHQLKWMADYPAVTALFDQVFVSSEIGHRKPERTAFEAISAATGIKCSEMLFFDDMLENVEGAINAGLQGIQVLSPSDVKRVLQVI